jgi:hypothetical protein
MTMTDFDRRVIAEYLALPPAARGVLAECVAEATRNVESSDVHSPADVAADVASRLHAIYEPLT